MKDRLYSALFRISNDPPGDGNCQFSVVFASLTTIGLCRSVENLREKVVQYLENNPHMETFTAVLWQLYRGSMAYVYRKYCERRYLR